MLAAEALAPSRLSVLAALAANIQPGLRCALTTTARMKVKRRLYQSPKAKKAPAVYGQISESSLPACHH